MRIIRRPRVVMAALAASVLLAGCGAQPSQVNAAVMFADRAISVDQIQQMVAEVVRAEPAARELARNHRLDLVYRALINQLVIHEVLATAVAREGLRVDEAEVGAALAQNQLGIALPADGSVPPQALAQELAFRARDHREVYVDLILLRQLGEKYLPKLAVTLDYTGVPFDDPTATPGTTRERVLTKAQQLATSPNPAEIIAADNPTNPQEYLGYRVTAAQDPTLASSVLFGVDPGTVVAFQPYEQSASWLVAVIRERSVNSNIPIEQTEPPNAAQLSDVGRRMLQPLIASVTLKINPRYGTWDPVAMALAPSEAETQGFVVTRNGTIQS